MHKETRDKNQLVHAAELCRNFELYEVPQLLKLKGQFQSAVAFYNQQSKGETTILFKITSAINYSQELILVHILFYYDLYAL